MSDLKYLRLNGEAVAAILENRKSQMRFAVKSRDGTQDCPYKVGDLIGVKETWTILNGEYVYRVDDEMPEGWHMTSWRASTQMPKEAVRLFLEVESVRVERLQDISVDDVGKEGVWTIGTLFPVETFAGGWDASMSERKREKYGWNQNPLVFVVGFKRTEVLHENGA